MKIDVGTRLPLDVPYFQQTRIATCGPACLMMVMKYWDPAIEFSRRFEFELWRKSFSLFLFGGTFQFGLAAAATMHGFSSEIYQQRHFSDNYPKYPWAVRLIENIVSSKARLLNVPIRYGQENIVVIQEALNRSIPPIVFVNLHPILGEHVFHWIVVTGVDEQNAYINDPYVPRGFPMQQKKNYPIPLEVLHRAMMTEQGRTLRFPPCVILVHH